MHQMLTRAAKRSALTQATTRPCTRARRALVRDAAPEAKSTATLGAEPAKPVEPAEPAEPAEPPQPAESAICPMRWAGEAKPVVGGGEARDAHTTTSDAVAFGRWCPRAMACLALALFDPTHALAAHAAWGPVVRAAPALARHARRSQQALAEAKDAVHTAAGGIGAGADAELERALVLATGRYRQRCERADATLARWSAVTRELRSSSVLLATHMRSVEAHLAAERTQLRRCAHAATAGGGEQATESLHWREPLHALVELKYEQSLRTARGACDVEWGRVPRDAGHTEWPAKWPAEWPDNVRSVHIARYMRRSDECFEAATLTAALAIYAAVDECIGAPAPWHTSA